MALDPSTTPVSAPALGVVSTALLEVVALGVVLQLVALGFRRFR